MCHRRANQTRESENASAGPRDLERGERRSGALPSGTVRRTDFGLIAGRGETDGTAKLTRLWSPGRRNALRRGHSSRRKTERSLSGA